MINKYYKTEDEETMKGVLQELRDIFKDYFKLKQTDIKKIKE